MCFVYGVAIQTHEDFLSNNLTKSIIDTISIRNITVLNKNLVNVKKMLEDSVFLEYL